MKVTRPATECPETAATAPYDAAAGLTPPRRIRPAPVVLNRYRLHKRLGTGGFATVWLARDERLERDVAVKVLPRERVAGGRFEREARAAARLSHPAIVTLYEAAVDDDGAYLVSELIRGTTLAHLLQAGSLSDCDVAEIGIAVCDALGHAHAQGVVHRDVKPSNVLVPERPVTKMSVAKLTDFGVARVIGGDSLTRTGDVIGTAAYMAPEQAEGREAGAAADLYSLALVLYEAFTGVNPLRAGAPTQRARRLGAHLPPLRRYRRDLPRELGSGIDLALRPRARERGSLQELRRALVASRPALGDSPGIVAPPWQLRDRRELRSTEPEWRDPEPSREDAQGPGDREPSAPPPSWLARGLAGAAAAGATAWIAGRLLPHPLLAPAALALVAAVAVVTLPRAGWLATCALACLSLLLAGRFGAALVIAAAALIPMALLPRAPSRWPLAASAPALGLVGVAGVWPALAGRAPTAWQRFGLGVTGWLWLGLGGPIAGRGLYTTLASGTPAPSAWTGSLGAAIHHVLAPVLSSGMLASAGVWGLGAALLPRLLANRPVGMRAVLVATWSGLVVLIAAMLASLAPEGIAMRPGTAIVGALAGAAVTLGLSTATGSGWARLWAGQSRLA
jgi:eukaryotic-like serine/threonine-protein kinase